MRATFKYLLKYLPSPLALVLAFTLLLATNFSLAHTLVGNGGEGIREGETIYLRDLHEYGAQHKAWVGTEKNPAFEKAIAEWQGLKLTRAQADLLVRKLTDAEKFYPNLGYAIMGSLSFFNWRWVENDLGLLPEWFALKNYPDNVRVQVASRYLGSILIHRPSFEKMNESHQVALLIHEAIYSFTRLTSIQGYQKPIQNLGATKAIVSGLFSEDSYFQGTLTRIVPMFLIVPSASAVSPPLMSHKLTMSLYSHDGAGSGILTFLASTSLGYDRRERHQSIRDLCMKAKWTPTPDYIISIEAHRPTLARQPEVYESAIGQQILLNFFEQAPTYSRRFDIKDGHLCLNNSCDSRFNCQTDIQRDLDIFYF